MALNALKSFFAGWVTTTFWASKITPPPTGMSAFFASSWPPPEESPEDDPVVAGVVVPEPAVPPPESLPPPHATSNPDAVTAPAAATPRSTCRREGEAFPIMAGSVEPGCASICGIGVSSPNSATRASLLKNAAFDRAVQSESTYRLDHILGPIPGAAPTPARETTQLVAHE